MRITDMLLKEDKEVLELFNAEAIAKGRECVTDHDNYLFIKGDHPICLVAHIDTVSPIKTKVGRDIVMQRGQLVAYREISGERRVREVLGADDRAGCWILWQILTSHKKRPHILLTNYEECGGHGARKFVADNHDLSDITLFIELDRRGCNHYVEYTTNPQEVHDFIQSFGIKSEGRGSFSDISIISRETKIPAVNLSCGYNREHSERESLDIEALYMMWHKLERIINCCPFKSFGQIEEPKMFYPVSELFGSDDDQIICVTCGDYLQKCTCPKAANGKKWTKLAKKGK